MNPDDIAEFLTANPGFFEQYPDALAQINLPSPHGSGAVSLGERQMSVLRDKVRQFEAKLAELLRFGQENDAISEKVHALAVELIEVNDFDTLARILYASLVGVFGVPHAALRIWGYEQPAASGSGQVVSLSAATPAAEFLPVGDHIKAWADGLSRPYCGTALDQEAVDWFGARAEKIRSLAQIPLQGSQGCCGLLVLASDEAERFQADMGVLYLERIGEMASAALRRVLAR